MSTMRLAMHQRDEQFGVNEEQWDKRRAMEMYREEEISG